MKQSKEQVEIIRALIEDESRGIDMVYRTCYPRFIKRIRKAFPKASQEDIEDIFQEVLIILIVKFIREGRFEVVDDKVKGLWVPLYQFLFVIGYRMMCRQHEKMIKKRAALQVLDPEILYATESEEQLALAKQAYNQLEPECKRLVYYRVTLNLDAQSISELITPEKGSKPSRGAIRTRIYRCMKVLRAHYKELTLKSEK